MASFLVGVALSFGIFFLSQGLKEVLLRKLTQVTQQQIQHDMSQYNQSL